MDEDYTHLYKAAFIICIIVLALTALFGFIKNGMEGLTSFLLESLLQLVGFIVAGFCSYIVHKILPTRYKGWSLLIFGVGFLLSFFFADYIMEHIHISRF